MNTNATPRLVDLHCHLDLYPDHAAAVARAEAAGVYTLAVTTTPRAWPQNRQLAGRTRFVRAALGLHPQLVAEHASELTLWERYLPEAKYVGEVGLDAGPRFNRSLPAQVAAFSTILDRCAEAGGKILSVHSTRATRDVLDLVERCLPPGRGTVVLHWFTGSKVDAVRAVRLGCYFSVNLQMLNTDRGRALLGAIPLDRILTETDGPFTNVAGRPAEPADVTLVLDAIAAARQVKPADVASGVLDNLRRLAAAE